MADTKKINTPKERLQTNIDTLHKVLIEACMDTKDKNPDGWRWPIKQAAKELLGVDLQYNQFNKFMEGSGRNIKFYFGMFAAIIAKKGKVDIKITETTITINGITHTIE